MVERREDTPSVPSSGEAVATKLRRIARKARSDPKFQFTSLYHLMNEELLRECFRRLQGRAAAGIDRVTKAKCPASVSIPRLHARVRLYSSS